MKVKATEERRCEVGWGLSRSQTGAPGWAGARSGNLTLRIWRGGTPLELAGEDARATANRPRFASFPVEKTGVYAKPVADRRSELGGGRSGNLRLKISDWRF